MSERSAIGDLVPHLQKRDVPHVGIHLHFDARQVSSMGARADSTVQGRGQCVDSLRSDLTTAPP
jgi:hypothetical protein